MSVTSTTTTHAANLRRAANLLDEVGDRLPFQPYITSHRDGSILLDWFTQNEYKTEAEQKRAVQDITRLLGGKWVKGGYGDTFGLEQDRDGVRLSVTASRTAVCERVVTGTQQVVRPAVQASPERVETVEDVEWVCGSVLAEVVAS